MPVWLVLLLMAAPLEARPLIVLGVDGLDHAIVTRELTAGRLPSLAALGREGSWGPLLPTTPAESPVSWASLVTGRNPGKTGIFDFVRRIPGTYSVELATVKRKRQPLPAPPAKWLAAAAFAALLLALWLRVRKRRVLLPLLGLCASALLGAAAAVVARLPPELETAEPAREGEAFWDALGRAGQRVAVLWAPLEFPPRPAAPGVRLLSGLGTPDLAGTQGTYSLLTDRADRQAADLEMGGRVLPIRWSSGAATAAITGPLGVTCELTLQRRGDTLQVTGTEPPAELRPGQWSPLLRLGFPILPGFTINGISRLHLATGEGTSVYISPCAIDPVHPPPPARVSHPASYSSELADGCGLYTTLGWAADTMAVQDGMLDEGAFLESLAANYRQREKLLLFEARRQDWDVMFAVLEEPDRAGHVLWRATEPGHPAHTPELGKRFGGSVAEVYGWVDGTVRELRKARPDAAILLVSDHGFASWRRAVNLNRWLLEAGYIRLRTGADGSGNRLLADLFKGRNLWGSVDWSATRAYSVGLGLIYLNLAGREPEGIVNAQQAPALLEELSAKLRKAVDPETGEGMIRDVALAARIYSGRFTLDAPELVVGFAPGYRVSWQSALGGLDEPVSAPNSRAWSADHCSVDPASVPGVFFSTEKLRPAGATVLDVAPTILTLRGVSPDADIDGRSLR